jgi:hypothetical protein
VHAPYLPPHLVIGRVKRTLVTQFHNVACTCVALADDTGSPTSQGGGGSWHVGEFEDVCLSILTEKLWPMFGKSVIYFDHPVETNVVPDYYHVRGSLYAVVPEERFC